MRKYIIEFDEKPETCEQCHLCEELDDYDMGWCWQLSKNVNMKELSSECPIVDKEVA